MNSRKAQIALGFKNFSFLNLINRTFLDHLVSMSAAVISRCSMLLATLLNTQTMPEEEFGYFTILLIIANLIAAFVSCGGDMWLNRFTRKRHSDFKQAPAVARFYLAMSTGFASLVLLMAFYLGVLSPDQFNHRGMGIAICLLWAATTGLIESMLAILRATSIIKRFFLLRDFLMPVTLIVSVFILKPNTIESFFTIALTTSLCTFIILANFLYKNRKKYLRKFHVSGKFLKKVILDHTITLISNNFLARLANGQDTFLLARITPLSIVGQYRFVSHFSSAFSIVQHFVFLALPWQLRKTSMHTTEDQKAIFVKQLFFLITAFSALVVLIFMAKPLLSYLNQGFEAMAIPFIITLIIRFGDLFWGPLHELLITNKKTAWDTLANLVSILATTLVFLIALRFKEPVTAGLLSIAASSVLGQLTRFLLVKKTIFAGKHNKLLLSRPSVPLLLTTFSIIYLLAL